MNTHYLGTTGSYWLRMSCSISITDPTLVGVATSTVTTTLPTMPPMLNLGDDCGRIVRRRLQQQLVARVARVARDQPLQPFENNDVVDGVTAGTLQ